jgi:hypothetical protein
MGKTYAECKALLKKNEFIADYQTLQNLRNDDRYRELLGLTNTWAFVPNPDKMGEKNGYVARFDADSGRANLNCYWNPSYANSTLGVFIVRKNRKVSK